MVSQRCFSLWSTTRHCLIWSEVVNWSFGAVGGNPGNAEVIRSREDSQWIGSIAEPLRNCGNCGVNNNGEWADGDELWCWSSKRSL